MLSIDSTRITRLLLATSLLIGLLGSTFPLETIASGHMCTLACCASRAPHAAGSCMNDSCRAVFGKDLTEHHRTSYAQFVEPLCGLSRVMRRRPSSRYTAPQSSSDTRTPEAHLSSTTISSPCQRDCGSCGSGFADSFRQRNAAAVAHAYRSRLPSITRRGKIRAALAETLEALIHQCVPRAPPVSFPNDQT